MAEAPRAGGVSRFELSSARASSSPLLLPSKPLLLPSKPLQTFTPPKTPTPSTHTDVQYTNLKFQALSLGLGKEWPRICTSYAAANRALGDIVKARGAGA